MLKPPHPNWKLVTGAVYRCDNTDRGFLGLQWKVIINDKLFFEYGFEFLHGCDDSEIVPKIRKADDSVICNDNDSVIFNNFIMTREISATRLVRKF